MMNERKRNTSWPKISIVTPSLNQIHYIENTIRSVLFQGYPNLEYILIDGGSTDGSVEIIKKYDEWIDFWSSEADLGQSHAINKGFKYASGEIYAYINSDDTYEKDTLKIVANAFLENPDIDLIAGDCNVYRGPHLIRTFKASWPNEMSFFLKKTFSSTFAQPAAFWTARIHKKIGGFDDTMHYCFDREFFLRMGLAGIRPKLLPDKLARFHEHDESKTAKGTKHFHYESIDMLEKYYGKCGITVKEMMRIKKDMMNEIKYIEIFEKWQKKGRLLAITEFLKMIFGSPKLLAQRKVLGQAKRLLFYNADAAEKY